MNRRTVLGILAGSLCSPRALWAEEAARSDEFFIFIHAAGGWDVTLWADPRNERKGLVEPASTDNTDVAALRRWKGTRLDGDTQTFEILTPSDTSLRLGPAIGDLYDLRDRLTIVNGLEMNTVSHPDGVAYSITGRHLAAGHASQPSCDVVLAHERGTAQLIPAIAIGFPSAFVGDALDRRAIPLRMSDAGMFAKALSRSDAYLSSVDRDEITELLTREARDLGARSVFPDTYDQYAGQFQAQRALVAEELRRAFERKSLLTSYPMFDYRTRSFGSGMLAAPLAIEAMRRNLVRSVAFAFGGFDTHNDNYRHHATTLQDLFGAVATLLKQLDAIPHPTRSTAKLSEHTHILVFSDFCRTPQITLTGGRDHYPNNSALVISPKFRGGRSFGATDFEQLLPAALDGGRPLTPPDVLATLLHAFGIEPRRYLRDGKPQMNMLA